MNKGWKILIVINTVLILLLYVGIGIAGYYGYTVVQSFYESFGITDESDSADSDLTEDEETTEEETTETAETEEKLFSNDYVSVSFIKWEDGDLTSEEGVPTIYLKLKVENKYDKKIICAADNISINGEMIPSSASTYEIESGKSSSFPATLFTEDTGVENIKSEDIDEIEFEFTVYDDKTMDKLGKTKKCTVYKK